MMYYCQSDKRISREIDTNRFVLNTINTTGLQIILFQEGNPIISKGIDHEFLYQKKTCREQNFLVVSSELYQTPFGIEPKRVSEI
jgi:hypothetical protein